MILFSKSPLIVEVNKGLTRMFLSPLEITGSQEHIEIVDELWISMCDLPQSIKVNDLLTLTPG